MLGEKDYIVKERYMKIHNKSKSKNDGMMSEGKVDNLNRRKDGTREPSSGRR